MEALAENEAEVYEKNKAANQAFEEKEREILDCQQEAVDRFNVCKAEAL